MANIQQSINQLLGTATIGAGLYKNYKTQQDQLATQQEQAKLAQEEAEYNKPENVKARRIAELEKKADSQYNKREDKEIAILDFGKSTEEAQMATLKDLDVEASIYEELYDLTGDRKWIDSWGASVVMQDYYKEALNDKLKAQVRADEEIARKQAEDAKKQEESEKIRSQIMEGAPQTNITPREVIRPDERRDWKASAMNKLESRDKFTAFLDSLQNQMWDNQGGAK